MRAEHVGIVSAYETNYTRHPRVGLTAAELLAEAISGAVTDANLTLADVDGLAISSFSLAPDHVIDLAWKMGISVRWLMQDSLGGASGINMLQHAVRAVEAGDARVIVIAAGDNLRQPGVFQALTNSYNLATRHHLAPLEFGGPNTLFAMLTSRHMAATGLTERDYAQIPLAQRRWASLNPGAVYRHVLTLCQYLAAPTVATPLRQFDCVPVVAGADAVIVTTRQNRIVRLRAVEALHNADQQLGPGTSTGHRALSDALWDKAELGPRDIDVIGVYDDYPVIALEQLRGLGFIPDDDLAGFLNHRLALGMPVNTSGGQLSAGQAGTAGGLHFIVEATRQLLGRVGARQVVDARTALVSGYGMVLYRHGACANAAVLEVI